MTEARPAAPPFTRRALMTGGAIIAVVAAGAFAITWWTSGRFLMTTDNAYVRADVVTVTPQVAGTIVAVPVTDNQTVHAGEILARLDERDYAADVARAAGRVAAAQADIRAQQAHVAALAAESLQQNSVIAQGAAAVAAREADAHLADLDFARQTDLDRQQVNSAQVLQVAEATAHHADATVAEARAGLMAAQARLPVLARQQAGAAADLDKARAGLVEAQAELSAAQLNLDRAAIRSPVDGQIAARTVRAGHYAEVGTPLMAVVPDITYIVANYKETQTAAIRIGQPVRIVADAMGGAVLKGHVESLSPASGAEFALLPADNATGNFTKIVQRVPVRIRLDPHQPQAAQLRPGTSVETTVDTRSARP